MVIFRTWATCAFTSKDQKNEAFSFVSGLVRCDLVREETVMRLNQQFPQVFLSTVLTEMNRVCNRAELASLPGT